MVENLYFIRRGCSWRCACACTGRWPWRWTGCWRGRRIPRDSSTRRCQARVRRSVSARPRCPSVPRNSLSIRVDVRGTRVDERLDPLELVVWQKAIDGELGVGADELESVRYVVLRRLGGDVTSFRRAKWHLLSHCVVSFGELPNSQFWRSSE